MQNEECKCLQGLQQCACWLDWWATLQGSLCAQESSTIAMAKQPRYMVKSSTENNVHMRHLSNQAVSQVQKLYYLQM